MYKLYFTSLILILILKQAEFYPTKETVPEQVVLNQVIFCIWFQYALISFYWCSGLTFEWGKRILALDHDYILKPRRTFQFGARSWRVHLSYSLGVRFSFYILHFVKTTTLSSNTNLAMFFGGILGSLFTVVSHFENRVKCMSSRSQIYQDGRLRKKWRIKY